MSSITVAIAGGTGNIGSHVTHAFLSPQHHPNPIGRVILLTRDASSPKAKEFESLGAELTTIADSVTSEHLKGVDVLVNCLGHQVSPKIRDSYPQAAVAAGVKVYFPTEYGLDHRLIDFEHEVWDSKSEHEEYVRKLSDGKMKVICQYNGHFMEDAIGPWYGLDTKSGIYTSVGPGTAKVTMTGKDDVSNSLVRLAILAISDPNNVPDKIRISGDAHSYEEIATIMSKESGQTITVKSSDSPEHFFEELEKKYHGKGDPMGYIHYVHGTGRADLSHDNQNELVNPRESFWTWKTLEEYAKETKGRPWWDWQAGST